MGRSSSSSSSDGSLSSGARERKEKKAKKKALKKALKKEKKAAKKAKKASKKEKKSKKRARADSSSGDDEPEKRARVDSGAGAGDAALADLLEEDMGRRDSLDLGRPASPPPAAAAPPPRPAAYDDDPADAVYVPDRGAPPPPRDGHDRGGYVDRDEPYARAPDEPGAEDFADEAAAAAAEALVAERVKARSDRDYGRADDLRDELRRVHQVYVSDKDRTWRRERGRDGGPRDRGRATLPPYERGDDEPGAPAFESDDALQAAEALVAERAKCRSDREYRRADELRDELRRVHKVHVVDKDRIWRRIAVRGRGPVRARRSPSRSRSRSRSPSPPPKQAEVSEAVLAQRKRNADRFGGDGAGAARLAAKTGLAKLPGSGAPADFELPASSTPADSAPEPEPGPSAAELRAERLRKAREKQELLRAQMAAELPPASEAPPKPKAPAPPPPAKKVVSLKGKPRPPPAEDAPEAAAPEAAAAEPALRYGKDELLGLRGAAPKEAPEPEAPAAAAPKPKPKPKPAAAPKPVAAAPEPEAAAPKPVAAPAPEPEPAAPAPEPEAPAPAAAAPSLTKAQVDKMTVPLLKKALEARGLEVKGLKAALKGRLLDALGL